MAKTVIMTTTMMTGKDFIVLKMHCWQSSWVHPVRQKYCKLC